MTVNATAAPENLGQNPQDWLSNQKDLIEDGDCGCRMRLQSCRERQKQYPQVTYDKRESASETIRAKFIICVGCKYFERIKREKKRVNEGFRARPRIDVNDLENIHKRNQFTRATQGIVKAGRND